jgi:hypothetical protein
MPDGKSNDSATGCVAGANVHGICIRTTSSRTKLREWLGSQKSYCKEPFFHSGHSPKRPSTQRCQPDSRY